ncbi:hypothetical protein J2W54_004932 [Rhodococcus fascians]|nr:hypothetical protein [Rhodococcus sp. 3258]MDR6934516.1 hypothetical protein [Rhodococcus fascians]
MGFLASATFARRCVSRRRQRRGSDSLTHHVELVLGCEYFAYLGVVPSSSGRHEVATYCVGRDPEAAGHRQE